MDLSFSEEQQMLSPLAREFLEAECPKSLVRAMEADETGHSPELWQKMAELGWLGLTFPEQYGGAEFSFLDMAILLEEMGRAILPGPFFSTVVLCGQAILDAGSDEQKDAYLERIAMGELVMALALTEASGQYDADGIAVRAEPSGDGYAINGVKMFVSDGQAADSFIVAARSADTPDPKDGVSLLLVDADTPGVTVTPLRVMGIDKQAEVAFENVQVPADNLLGPPERRLAADREATGLGRYRQVRGVGRRRAGRYGAGRELRQRTPRLWWAYRQLPGHTAPRRQYAHGHRHLPLPDLPGRRACVPRAISPPRRSPRPRPG